MGFIKRSNRFITTLPPIAASPELRDWLREELERFELTGNAVLSAVDELRAAPRMFMTGQADDIADLGPAGEQLVNYDFGGSLGDVPVEPDPVAGTITIPIDGIYTFSFYVYGLQPSNTQNESIQLEVVVNGSSGVIASIDVASNQTQDRILSVTLTRKVDAGDVIAMLLSATGSMGPFLIQDSSLEVTIITSVDAAQAKALAINWNV